MKNKKSAIGNDSQAKNRTFVRANAAWDRGDLDQAFALFVQAAKEGDASSQLDLGYFYDQGLSVKQDKRKALEWYRRAYKQGDAGAANNIATVFRDLGDTKKMLWWLRRAAAMGDVDVLLDLGKRYQEGLEVPKNPARAKFFYRSVLSSKSATEDDMIKAKTGLTELSKRA